MGQLMGGVELGLPPPALRKNSRRGSLHGSLGSLPARITKRMSVRASQLHGRVSTIGQSRHGTVGVAARLRGRCWITPAGYSTRGSSGRSGRESVADLAPTEGRSSVARTVSVPSWHLSREIRRQASDDAAEAAGGPVLVTLTETNIGSDVVPSTGGELTVPARLSRLPSTAAQPPAPEEAEQAAVPTELADLDGRLSSAAALISTLTSLREEPGAGRREPVASSGSDVGEGTDINLQWQRSGGSDPDTRWVAGEWQRVGSGTEGQQPPPSPDQPTEVTAPPPVQVPLSPPPAGAPRSALITAWPSITSPTSPRCASPRILPALGTSSSSGGVLAGAPSPARRSSVSSVGSTQTQPQKSFSANRFLRRSSVSSVSASPISPGKDQGYCDGLIRTASGHFQRRMRTESGSIVTQQMHTHRI